MSQAQLARAARVAQPNLSAYENGRPTPTEAVLQRINSALEIPVADRVNLHRTAIRELVIKHHASEPRIFGSVARGDAAQGSDLDLLVDFTDEASLLDEVGLRLALSDLLDVEVDVIGAGTLRGELRERILHEAVAL